MTGKPVQVLNSSWQAEKGTLEADVGSTHTPEFSKVFEKYHGLVFRVAYRVTGNAADAEDVSQTIFLRMLRRQSAVEIGKEEGYFRRAAVNTSLDVLRSRNSAREVPLPDSPEMSESRPDDLRECLRRAFVHLTPRAAEIFALRYIEDFSNKQIAEALQMSQVLVAVTLHRTRRQLQKEIRSYLGVKS